MTVTVFVWRAHLDKGFGAGHASILINHRYVSWWPSASNDGVAKRLGNALASPASRHKMSDDIREEFGHASFTSAPIPGLDESRMEKWAELVLANGPAKKPLFEPIQDYALLSTNCAGLVLRALLVGKGMELGFLAFLMRLSVPLPRDCEYAARFLGG